MSNLNNKIDETPIVLFHMGKHLYFKRAVSLITRLGFRPIVIGDSNIFSEKGVCFIKFSEGDNFISDDWQEFIHNYVHLHTDQSSRIQLLSYMRWFVIHRELESRGYKRFWHLDSDIALFKSFRLYKKQMEEVCGGSALYKPVELHPHQMTVSAHASLWTVDDLKSFLDFMVLSYKGRDARLSAKWKYHQEQGISGGVCDMTLQYLWFESSGSVSKSPVQNISTILNQEWEFNDQVNHHLGRGVRSMRSLPDGSIAFIPPVSGPKNLSRKMPFIHCQGQAKPLIIFISYGLTVGLAIRLTNTSIFIREKIKNLINGQLNGKEF